LLREAIVNGIAHRVTQGWLDGSVLTPYLQLPAEEATAEVMRSLAGLAIVVEQVSTTSSPRIRIIDQEAEVSSSGGGLRTRLVRELCRKWVGSG
jgi:hypothetical protein